MVDLIVGIDSGSVHQGFTYFDRTRGFFRSGYLALRNFRADATYEEFVEKLSHSNEVAYLSAAISNACSVGAVIEIPNRRLRKKLIRNGTDNASERRLHQLAARYWRKWILCLNPNTQVDRLDSLKWQIQILGQGSSLSRLRYEQKAISLARILTCHPTLRCPHQADAICMAKYASDFTFPVLEP